MQPKWVFMQKDPTTLYLGVKEEICFHPSIVPLIIILIPVGSKRKRLPDALLEAGVENFNNLPESSFLITAFDDSANHLELFIGIKTVRQMCRDYNAFAQP